MSTVGRQPRAMWKDAYDAQMKLWSFESSSLGKRWLHEHYAMNAKELGTSTRQMLGALYAGEEDKVLGADPIYVSEEMCQVVEAAKESFKPEPLWRTDLLVDAGFVYFAKAFEVPDRFDAPTTIKGFSWSPMLSAPKDPSEEFDVEQAIQDWREGKTEVEPGNVGGGICLTLYCETETSSPASTIEWRHPTSPPPLLPMHVTPWWFDMTFSGNEVDENENATGAEWWWTIVQTTLRLMQQKISVRHQERPDRPERREGQRLGFRDREVLVVQLRRERSAEDRVRDPEEGNWSHRWIVGHHWRNQWYPASQVHRQIWIGDHVKGPKHLPLVVKPRRAYRWDR